MGSTGDRVAARERAWQKATRRAADATSERETIRVRFAAARAQRDAAEQVMAAALRELVASVGSVPDAAAIVGIAVDDAHRVVGDARSTPATDGPVQ